MIDIYLINAFPDRTERAKREIAKLANGAVHTIRAPTADEAAEGWWTGCAAWRDHTADKRLVTWGEIACFIGHHDAWQRIAKEGKSALIVEDDILVTKALPMDLLTGDICYFGGQPLAESHDTGEPTLPAPYMWCLHGYYITATAAQALIDATVQVQVLPADEFVPYHCGTNPNVDERHHGQRPAAGLNARMLREFVCEQGVNGQASTTANAPPAFDLLTLIFATDPSRVDLKPWTELGYAPEIIGAGEPEWDTNGRGGIAKLHWLRDHLKKRAGRGARRTIVLAVDGYDTQPLIPAQEMVGRWAGLDCPIVVGGELDCWPEDSLVDHEVFKQQSDDAPYRFPNSGTLMGWDDSFLAELTDDALAYDDDQLAVAWRCIRKPGCWKVDAGGYLFQTLHRVGSITRRFGRPLNTVTNTYVGLLHGNNGADMKWPQPFEWEDPIFAEDAMQWQVIGHTDILAMPFLHKRTLWWLDQYGARFSDYWSALEGDAVPGDEMRLRKLDSGLDDRLADVLNEHLAAIVNAYWRPATWSRVKDQFLIRHSASGQAALRLHHDISNFSCSIVLERADRGGELVFPRQAWDDRHIPAGWLLCWPSKITHPHAVAPVKQGRRLSCVVWTGE